MARTKVLCVAYAMIAVLAWQGCESLEAKHGPLPTGTCMRVGVAWPLYLVLVAAYFPFAEGEKT